MRDRDRATPINKQFLTFTNHGQFGWQAAPQQAAWEQAKLQDHTQKYVVGTYLPTYLPRIDASLTAISYPTYDIPARTNTPAE